MCSQPRRLAAVTIAERVAAERHSLIGGEVGYAIGQRAVATTKTRLVFVTAGSLLGRLRAKGESALSGVRFVIIDEVHERSTENDLLLAVLKQMMLFSSRKRSTPEAKVIQQVNIVIMSATFNRDKYASYFSSIPDAGVHQVSIPSPGSFETLMGSSGGPGRRSDNYLEQAVRLLNQVDPDADCEARSHLLRTHTQDSESPSGVVISRQLLNLVGDLIMAQSRELQTTERAQKLPVNTYGILVFLPTYRHIEEMAIALEHCRVDFMRRLRLRNERRWRRQRQTLRAQESAGESAGTDSESASDEEDDPETAEMRQMEEDLFLRPAEKISVCVLHSSLDVESATSTFASGGRRFPGSRRIFLATTIAESSVTIPDLACVIDLARTNRVFWDARRQQTFSKVEWSSRDSSDQRRGRTGRTCWGSTWQLVPATFAQHGLPAFEPPGLLRSSLREETLMSLCSKSKATKFPASLFDSCLDPPARATLNGALHSLLAMGALRSPSSAPEETDLNALLPTSQGRLLDALPVGLVAGKVALSCARSGLMREGAVLAALMSTTPLPIESSFRDPGLFMRRLQFFGESHADPKQPDSVLEAQLGAVIAHAQWAESLRAASCGAAATHADALRENPEQAAAYESDAFGSNEHSGSLRGSVDSFDSDLGEFDADDWYHFNSEDPLYSEEVWCRQAGLSVQGLAAVHEVAATVEAAIFSDEVNPGEAVELLNRTASAQRRGGDGWSGAANVKLETVVGAERASALRRILQDRHVLVPIGGTPSSTAGPSGGRSTDGRPLCTFFARGSCTRGPTCSFSHDTASASASSMPRCRFFASARGCSFGNACHFAHGSQEPAAASAAPTAVPDQGSAECEEEEDDDPHSLPSWGKVLLLGEANFAYAAAVADAIGSKLVATAPESCAATAGARYNGPSTLRANVSAVVRAGGKVVFGVNAKTLGSIDPARLGIDLFGHERTAISRVIFNFPEYEGVVAPDSSLSSQTVRLADNRRQRLFYNRFFQELTLLAARGLLSSGARVHLRLQRGQLGRWRVLEAARRAFWDLAGTVAEDEFSESSGKLCTHAGFQ